MNLVCWRNYLYEKFSSIADIDGILGIQPFAPSIVINSIAWVPHQQRACEVIQNRVVIDKVLDVASKKVLSNQLPVYPVGQDRSRLIKSHQKLSISRSTFPYFAKKGTVRIETPIIPIY